MPACAGGYPFAKRRPGIFRLRMQDAANRVSLTKEALPCNVRPSRLVAATAKPPMSGGLPNKIPGFARVKNCVKGE